MTEDTYDIFYIRNWEGKETDFLITKNAEPYLLIEVKINSTSIERHHKNFAKNLNVPFIQIVRQKNVLKREGKNIFIISAERFFG